MQGVRAERKASGVSSVNTALVKVKTIARIQASYGKQYVSQFDWFSQDCFLNR